MKSIPRPQRVVQCVSAVADLGGIWEGLADTHRRLWRWSWKESESSFSMYDAMINSMIHGGSSIHGRIVGIHIIQHFCLARACACGSSNFCFSHTRFHGFLKHLRDARSISLYVHIFSSPQQVRLEQVVAMDVNFTLLTRVWCVAELVEADHLHISQVRGLLHIMDLTI